MHELTLALNIIDLVGEECRKAEAFRVIELVITAGSLSGVDRDALSACLEIASRDTLLQDARIIINRITGVGFCRACQRPFPMEDILTLCPCCHQAAARLLEGQDLQIESLLVE